MLEANVTFIFVFAPRIPANVPFIYLFICTSRPVFLSSAFQGNALGSIDPLALRIRHGTHQLVRQ
jgi:hypothetical protein